MRPLCAALFLLMLGLLPLSAQARAMPCHEMASPTLATDTSPQATALSVAPVAGLAIAASRPPQVAAASCPHHPGKACHCSQACGAAGLALPVERLAPMPVSGSRESPALPPATALRTAPPPDLLRPPTLTL